MSSKQRGERKKSGSYISNHKQRGNYPASTTRDPGSVTGSLNHLNRYSSQFHSDW